MWKKVMGVGIFILVLTTGSWAQSLAQDIEELVLDYQKLAQLKHLLGDMKSAYARLHGGYETIKGIAKGNFNLHEAYLSSLLMVSPVVRDYEKVRSILNNEMELVKEYEAAKGAFAGSGRFSAAEADYFSKLYLNLFDGSLRDLDELAMVLGDGELRMSDAERLGAIDRIDRDMTAKLGFWRVFNANTLLMAGRRELELNDVNGMRGLQGVK